MTDDTLRAALERILTEPTHDIRTGNARDLFDRAKRSATQEVTLTAQALRVLLPAIESEAVTLAIRAALAASATDEGPEPWHDGMTPHRRPDGSLCYDRSPATLAAEEPAEGPEPLIVNGDIDRNWQVVVEDGQRVIRPTPARERLDVERLAEWMFRTFGADVDYAQHPDPMTEDDWRNLARSAAEYARLSEKQRPAVPALDVERLAQALDADWSPAWREVPVIGPNGVEFTEARWDKRALAEIVAREYAALQEQPEWTDPKG